MNCFHKILKKYWGYDVFRPLQEEIISSIYSRRDTLGLMPTGGGKTLTFQVPTLLSEGICLVITPLIALMKDQVEALRKKNIKATMIHSEMNYREVAIELENCILGQYKFLYLSPERLNSKLFLIRLQDMKVCIVTVDESHCISRWGYDFRPSYLQIAQLRDRLPNIPVLALTATATPQVIDDIQEKLCFKKKNVFSKSFERKNIVYVVRKTEDKRREILTILQAVSGSGIIYVRSRKKAEEIAEELQRQGIEADFFHAGLTFNQKIHKQNLWKHGVCRIMVCTNAFGMGIDKPDVRIVIHFEMPTSLEEYFQEAGRAGRDENKAYAVALFSSRDISSLKRRIRDEFPSKEFIKNMYEKLAYFYAVGIGMGIYSEHDLIMEKFCTLYHYDKNHVYAALKILDMAGYIEYREEIDRQSKLIFLIQRERLYEIGKLRPPLENLLLILLRSHTGLFVNYIHIKETDLAQKVGITPNEVYEGLKWLSSQKVIHYIPAKKNPVIYYLKNREEQKHIVIPHSVYEERLTKLEEKVKNVIDYSTNSDSCRSQSLLRYFGETEALPCGYCDVCLAKKKNVSLKSLF